LPVKPGQWHTVRLDWNLNDKTCQVTIDSRRAASLTMSNSTMSGISYVRFCSLAKKGEVDTAGLVMDWVKAQSHRPRSLKAY
jgi:hypothetical protein